MPVGGWAGGDPLHALGGLIKASLSSEAHQLWLSNSASTSRHCAPSAK